MKFLGLGLDMWLIVGGFYLLVTLLPLLITIIHDKRKKRKEGGL